MKLEDVKSRIDAYFASKSPEGVIADLEKVGLEFELIPPPAPATGKSCGGITIYASKAAKVGVAPSFMKHYILSIKSEDLETLHRVISPFTIPVQSKGHVWCAELRCAAFGRIVALVAHCLNAGQPLNQPDWAADNKSNLSNRYEYFHKLFPQFEAEGGRLRLTVNLGQGPRNLEIEVEVR